MFSPVLLPLKVDTVLDKFPLALPQIAEGIRDIEGNTMLPLRCKSEAVRLFKVVVIIVWTGFFP